MPRQRILMTGATGAVGKLLRPLLRDRFDMRLSGREAIEGLEPGEEFVAGDLQDRTFVDRLCDGVDGIVHLAGLVAPAVTFRDTLGPNYEAVLNLLDACRTRDIKRFVFASSHHIVGMLPADQTWDGDAPVAPDSFYGLSKAFGEAACSMYARRYGIRTLVVRIGNADPEIVDGRRERIWTSAADLAQLVKIGLTHPTLAYAVVNGASRCDEPLLGLNTAEALGYEPRDSARGHRAAAFRPREAMGPHEGTAFVGGFFAMNDLPNLETKP